MITAFAYIKHALRTLGGDERAQDAFEYLLVIGGVTVAVVVAVSAFGANPVNQVISGVCDAIDTINFMSVNC